MRDEQPGRTEEDPGGLCISMNPSTLSQLNGKNVLVCSTEDHRNPPTGRRGTIFVRDAQNPDHAVVEVEIEFPQMFTTAAHMRRVVLTEPELAELVASEHGGTFTVTLRSRLDPATRAGNE